MALPNILSGYALVPELLQHEGTAENLAKALGQQWRDRSTSQTQDKFLRLHRQLRQDANRQAARAVVRLLDAKLS